jgi:hypothetical protein
MEVSGYFMPGPLYLLEITLVPTKYVGPVWTFWSRKRFVTPTGVKKGREKGREDEEEGLSSY